MLNFASICPHPPIIIPSIGQENLTAVTKTIKAMKELEKKLLEAKPKTLIVISPHGPVQIGKMTIILSPALSGDFSMFGDSTSLSFENNLALGKIIREKNIENNIPVDFIENIPLDHGTLVPLYYLTKNLPNVKIIPLTFSYLDYKTHFKFGKIIGEIIKDQDKKIGVIASGDLSHRLIPDAPAGYSPRGKEFDQKLIELLEKNEVEKILNLDPDLIESAGECGLRSVIILLGILSSYNYEFQKLSYEGPFGVGYLVGNFRIA